MEKSKKLVNTLYIITNVFFYMMSIVTGLVLIALIVTTFINITVPDILPDVITVGQSLTIDTASLIGKDINSLVSVGLITATLSLAYLVYLLVILKSILKNVKKDQVFIETNVKKIKLLAYSLILWAFVSSFLQFILTKSFMTVLFEQGISQEIRIYDFSLDLQTVFFGLIILLLSEIFSHGVHLQNEYDATV